MKDFKSGLNPFSSENLTMFLTISVIMGTLLVLVTFIDKVIIPRLNPENKFRKWFEDHIMRLNPFDKN